MNGISLYYANRRNQQVDPDRSVAILYHRKFLLNNSLFYLQNVPYLEDGEFIARVLCLAKRGGIYNIPYYYRLNRPGSATRSDLNKQRRSINGFILAALNLKKFKESNDLNIDQKNFLNGPIIKFTLLTIQSTANIRGIKNYFWAKKQLIDNNLVNLDVAGKLNIYKKWAKIYNRSINLFLLTYLKHQLTQKFLK